MPAFTNLSQTDVNNIAAYVYQSTHPDARWWGETPASRPTGISARSHAAALTGAASAEVDVSGACAW